MQAIPYEFHSAFNDDYNLVTRKILRMLSENSRIHISEISDAIGLSRRSIRERMVRMEKELGMRYTVEFDEEALGLTSPHLTLIQFKKKPDYDTISAQLSKSYVPQLAASLKGQESMFMYSVAASSRDYVHWDNAMTIALSPYGARWHTSELVHRQLGFFPLRSEVLERLKIEPKHKEMLKLLNSNARISFQEFAGKLGTHFNTVAYNFNKLLKEGYIRRFTIAFDRPKDVTLAAFFAKYTPLEGFERHALKVRKAFQADDENSLVSRYIVCAPLIGSYDHFGIGAFDSFGSAYRHIASYHRQVLGDHLGEISCREIGRVLLGSLPIRSIDTKRDYKTIEWTSDLQ